MPGPDTISPQQLSRLIGTADAPVIIDVRMDDDFDADPRLIPTAERRDYSRVADWAAAYDGCSVVVACQKGLKLSQGVAAWLRQSGIRAEILDGGHLAWTEAGGMVVKNAAFPPRDPRGRTIWVTRARPKIDRIACPWLIRRFLDPQSRILFVDPDEIVNVARESGGVPFDVKDVELSHDGERCSFDTMLKLFGLESEPSLARLAVIVRGADTARPNLAPEAAGLHAVSLGLSALAGDDDHGLLQRGFLVYDALFAWLRFAAEERHNWPARAA